MTDEEINRKFDVVADHLASLAITQEKAEARTDRLERMLLLAIRAGGRERKDTREKIAALVDSHIKLADAQQHTDEAMTRMADAQAKLAESQAHSDARLDALIDIVREGRNGKS